MNDANTSPTRIYVWYISFIACSQALKLLERYNNTDNLTLGLRGPPFPHNLIFSVKNRKQNRNVQPRPENYILIKGVRVCIQ